MTNSPTTPGRVALITGGSGGIGAAAARRLAGKGYSLLLTYGKNHTQAQACADACRALGAEIELRSTELTEPGQVGTLVESCLGRFGRLDALVHCAGVAQESLLATLDDATVQRLIAIHVTSTVGLVRAAIRPMMLQRYGRIVLMSSVAAQKPSQGASVYAGCKGFVESFVRAMAVEVGRKGVTVNAVAPGMVDTNMTASVRSLLGVKLAERTAAKRLAAPDEIASAVEFLCDKDSAYVNGHVLAVDGAYLGPP